MASATIHRLGRLGSLVLALSATGAMALERVEFQVAGGDKSLTRALKAASVVLAAEADGQTDAQDILADGRAEYAALLSALYARGHYSAVIHVYADGREVAQIAPLDDPAVVNNLVITVDPGPRFALDRARVAPLASRTTLPDGFRAGKPAESGVIVAAANAGVEGWRKVGHAKAAVAAQDIVADHARATLSADIQLAPGPVLRFGPLAIEGNERLRERRLRKIAGLPEGEVFDPEELARVASRLRRTGIFKSVTLIEDETITRPDLLGITASVTEQKPRRYSFGAEVSSLEGITLSAGWLHRNLLGGGERLELSGKISNIAAQNSGVDYELGLKLDRPATLTPDTNLGFEVVIGRFDETDYTANSFGFSTTLTHIFSDSLSGRGGLSYDYARVTDVLGDYTYRHLSMPFGLTWDRRNSKTDATRGFYIDAELKPFIGFGITDNGARARFDMRGYRAFGEEKRFTLAARIQAGSIMGSSLLGTPRDDLFYSGGAGSVRGQPYQSLGVDLLRGGVTTRIGGTEFVSTSLEARVRATETIGVVGFVDLGRIDVDGFFADSGDWHAGAGLGLRYATGIGPIRLDLAVPVSGSTGDGVQIYVGLGQAF
jgi:translocation and assembly module TamA